MATTARRGWITALVALLFGLVLAWGLLRYGGAETTVLYRLFLLLLIPATLAIVGLPLRRLASPRLVLLPVVGVFLLGMVTLQPTLLGRGYVHLAVGWLALFLTLRVGLGNRALIRFMAFLLILLGAVEALYGLAQAIGGVDFIGSYYRGVGRIATGTLINRNHFAGMLNMTLPLGLGVLFSGYARRRRRDQPRSESLALIWIVILASSIMGLAVLLSQSRGGTISLIATLLFLALLLGFGRKLSRGRNLSATVAWVLLITTMGLGLVVGVDALLERLGRLDQDLERFTIYSDTLEMIEDEPVAGVGPGMYRWRFRPYQTVDVARLYDHAHNDYLESAAEWGVPLALLVWGFVLWRFSRAVTIFLVSRDPERRGLALGCSAAIFSIMTHSLVDFTLQLPALLMLFCAILGLAWSLDVRRRRDDPRSSNGVVLIESRRPTP